MTHIAQWAVDNNLKLNPTKSTEMIVHNRRHAVNNAPPPLAGVQRVQSLNILGVIIQDTLSMAEHVDSLVTAGSQNLYALKTLKAHGLADIQLSNVCRATLVARLTYAASAWFGYTSAADKARLQAVVDKAMKWGLYKKGSQTLDTLVSVADRGLFKRILNDPSHVLHRLLPPIKSSAHNLRKRLHNRVLPIKSNSLEQNFLMRMLYL